MEIIFKFISAYAALVNTECTTGVELLVDGKLWPSNGTTLYKPVGSSGNFVRCRQCDDGSARHPSWFNPSGQKIHKCDEMSPGMICVNFTRPQVRDLKISNFMQSHVGNYTCQGDVDALSIMIDVMLPPTITTHPTSQVTTVSTSVIFDCEGTGRGSITYHWETRSTNGGKWITIFNGQRFVLSIRQSQQYRCVVSNEAGSTTSNVATITVLSEGIHSYIVMHVKNIIID